jgi:hypothetical protein
MFYNESTSNSRESVSIKRTSKSSTESKIINVLANDKRPSHDVVFAARVQSELMVQDANIGFAIWGCYNVAEISSMVNNCSWTSVGDVVRVEVKSSK